MARTSNSQSTDDPSGPVTQQELDDIREAEIFRTSEKARLAILTKQRAKEKAKKHAAAPPPVIVTISDGDDADVSDLEPVGSEDEVPHKGIMALGTTSYMLRGDDTIETIKGERIWNHGSRDTSFEIGKLSDIALVDGIPIVQGVNVIYGMANTGKTPILTYLSKVLNAALIRAGEPYPGYLRSTAELAGAMLRAEEKVICVDSLKNVTGRLSGNATSGGLSREFFAALSDMSSFFAERGQAVFVVVNISSKRTEVINETVEALESNTTSLWHMTEAGQLEWLVRSDVGKKRRSGVNGVTWAGDGIVKSLTKTGPSLNPTMPEARSFWVDGDIKVEATALNRALSRVLRGSLNNL